MADFPLLEFTETKLIEDVNSRLRQLPEYAQSDFFSADLRAALIEDLGLNQAGWRNLFRDMWKSIGDTGFVVVRNIPFDSNNRLSVALASLLGTPVAHNSKVPDLVREINPRGGDRPLENFPHTDSPHWIAPNDMITLECKREDQHIDVFSRIVPISKVLTELERKDPELVDRLYSKQYPFLLIPDDGEGGYQMQPVLTRVIEGGEQCTHVRFCLTDSKTCVTEFGLDESLLDDLIAVEKAVDEIGERTQFGFYRGDWLVFDNKRAFHSKTPTSPDTVRTLKKMKLEIDRNRLHRPEAVYAAS